MEQVLPDLDAPAIWRLVPSLLVAPPRPAPVPDAAAEAEAVVLLVIDGLGWEQLGTRAAVAPTLTAMSGAPATSVAPSTTATALTSITCGLPPAEHGVVGYRMRMGEADVLNVLRWSVGRQDANELYPPQTVQRLPAFGGREVPVVTRAEFDGTGFTAAHLRGARLMGWRVPSTIPVEVGAALAGGERFVYAYYDGLDRVAHDHGLGAHYDAELRMVDRMVSDLLDLLPPSAALVVTADHGQVEVGDRRIVMDDRILAMVSLQSGEGRFRWLHAADGVDPADLAAVAADLYGDVAWIATRKETVASGWFGGDLTDGVAHRLGDVALVPFEPVAFVEEDDTGPLRLISRHGSLTPAEMWVPVVAARGRGV